MYYQDKRKTIVDNIISLCFTSLLGLKENHMVLLSILYVIPYAMIEPVTECFDW